MTPLTEPVSVDSTVPASLRTVSVIPCEPLAEATVPWLRIATEKLTELPADGVFGVQLTTGTRSELATGVTVNAVGLAKVLFDSFCSMTALLSSTLDDSG